MTPLTYFSIGSTLAGMVNIEANLLTTEPIRVPNGGRVAYVGQVDIRTMSALLTRDGFIPGKWLISLQDFDNFAAYLYTEYGNYTTSSKAFYISTLDEFGRYSPYSANVERPSTADGTLTIPDSGGWYTGVLINLEDCILQSTSYSANHTRTTSERLLYFNTASGSITDALPAAAGVTTNTVYSAVKTSASNNLVIDPNGSEKIDGASTKTVTALNARVDFYTDGSNWFTI